MWVSAVLLQLATMASLAAAMSYKAVEAVASTADQDDAYLKKELSSSLVPMNLAPLQRYSDKLMRSIWGMYNMNAPHAFQKNAEDVTTSGQPKVAQGASARLVLLGHH